MADHDVIVIGAGPAGLTAAKSLANAGYDVVVLEEHPLVGQPVHCTGLLGVEAFDELPLPRDSILGLTGSARFWGVNDRAVLIESDSVRAAVIDRAAFDLALARDAEGSGATIRTCARVQRLEIGARSVKVTLDDGATLSARASILACGANYRFHRQLGLERPTGFLQTAQIETPFAPRPHVEVRVGRTLAPGGFGWMVPFTRAGRPHARIGLMCRNRARQRFASLVNKLCDEAGIRPDTLPPPRLKILPFGASRKTHTSRLVAVGDAAGLTKPTTGGGIYYGLLTGGFAAETLDDALRVDDLSESRLRAYDARWRKRIGPEIRAGLAFRAVVSRLDDRALDALVELARTDGIVPLLKQHANFNWHRAAALALLRHSPFRRLILASV